MVPPLLIKIKEEQRVAHSDFQDTLTIAVLIEIAVGLFHLIGLHWGTCDSLKLHVEGACRDYSKHQFLLL